MQHNSYNSSSSNNNNQLSTTNSSSSSSSQTTNIQSNSQQQNDLLKIKRGFKLTHQKLVLDIDLDRKSIEGYTEIIIQPQTRRLRVDKIRLNCRQCFVTKCEVNQVETPFSMKNYLETIVANPEIRDMNNYQAYTKAALHSSDEGELFIDVPPSVQFFEGISITEQQQQRNIIQFSPLVIKIYFRLVNPISSLQFILPDSEEYPLRKPHMFTYSQPDGARMWFPSVDQINEKCTWELDLTANSNLVVVATGQLLEKVCNEDETKNTFIYRQDIPTSANAIGFCVGPFEIYPDPYLPNVTHFCLPHKLTELKHSVHFFHQIYQFYEEYLGASFPYSSYKQVFVEDTLQPASSYATLSILNSHLLHGPTIIDQTFETRKLIAKALTLQWFGLYLSPKSWSDAWLFLGLSGYLASQFTKKHFGLNEYRYNLVKEEEFVCNADNGTYPPLYHESYCQPIDMYSELAQRKSPLVIYMIEKRITEEGLRKVINSLLNISISSLLSSNNNNGINPNVNNQNLSLNGGGGGGNLNQNDQLTSSTSSTITTATATTTTTTSDNNNNNNGLVGQNSSNQNIETMIQTKKFLKLIKSMTGHDLKHFSEKWIYGRGSPNLICGFNFNRKKFMTEFALKQVLNRPEDKISGTLMIRIVELDGSFEQVINFEDDMFEYDFPCHSRCRKTKKKKLLSEDGEEMEIDLSQKRETPLLWFRIDPELEWIHRITFRQPEYMWIHQLELDRDVIAQMEAIKGLKDYISFNSVRAVFKFIQNSRYFYRVRCDAAMLLSKLSTKETNFEGLNVLVSYFKGLFFDRDSNQLKPNSFKDFNSYFMQKSIPLSISLIKDKEGRTPIECIEFLIELLKDNDNSLNTYSDCYYLEALLSAFSNIHTTNELLLKKIKKQVARYLKYDQLYPSYRNCVTIGCLKAYCQLYSIKNSKDDLDFSLFKEYSTYSHFEEVRKVALQSIYKLAYQFQCSPGTGSINDYFLDLFDNEQTLMIKHFIIQMITSPPTNIEEKQYISMYKDDLRLIDRLWSYLNSKVTSFDIPLKVKIQKLYRLFWGKTIPPAFQKKLKSIKQTNKKPSGSSSSKRDGHTNSSRHRVSSGSSGSAGVSSTNKKRKGPDDLNTGLQQTPEQPLKIHIKLGGGGGGSSQDINSLPSLPTNSSSSNLYNGISLPSNNTNGISLPSNTIRDYNNSNNSVISSSSSSINVNSNANNNHHHSSSSSSEISESKQDIVKKLLEKDNDPDLKEFLEIQDKEKKHRERTKSRDHRHSGSSSSGSGSSSSSNISSGNTNSDNTTNNFVDVNNNNNNNNNIIINEKDSSPFKDKDRIKDNNISNQKDNNNNNNNIQIPNESSPLKDKQIISSDSEPIQNIPIVNNNIVNKSTRDKILEEIDLDLENDIEFKKDLSLLEGIEKITASKSSSRDHHRSRDHRDSDHHRSSEHRKDREHRDSHRSSSDKEYRHERDREHRSSTDKDSHRSSSSSSADKDSHRSADKEHRHERDREHRSSTDKDNRSSSSSSGSGGGGNNTNTNTNINNNTTNNNTNTNINNSNTNNNNASNKIENNNNNGEHREHKSSSEKEHRDHRVSSERDHRASIGSSKEHRDRDRERDKEHRDRDRERDKEHRSNRNSSNSGERDHREKNDRSSSSSSSSGGSNINNNSMVPNVKENSSTSSSKNNMSEKDIKMVEKDSIKPIVDKEKSSDRPEKESKSSKRGDHDSHHSSKSTSDRHSTRDSNSDASHHKESKRDHKSSDRSDKNLGGDSHRPVSSSSTINAGDTVGESMEVDILDDDHPAAPTNNSSTKSEKRLPIKIKLPVQPNESSSSSSSSSTSSSSSSSTSLSTSSSSLPNPSSKEKKSSKSGKKRDSKSHEHSTEEHNVTPTPKHTPPKEQKPEQKPEQKSEQKPEQKPEQKKQDTQSTTGTGSAAPKLVIKIKSPFALKPQTQPTSTTAATTTTTTTTNNDQPSKLNSTTTTTTQTTQPSTKPPTLEISENKPAEPKKLVLKIPLKK
ncbi:hypothetical protein ACTFIW_006884 [Dictyostelium discoideum]